MTSYQLYLAVLGTLTDEEAKACLLELYKRAKDKESEHELTKLEIAPGTSCRYI